ncbi:hypothetical protein CRYUN_Cryun31cG0100000 [Craigia yunnanensis]
MVVSSTVIFLTFSRLKNVSPPKQTLRSCLSSEGKKRDKKKKKKVQFAENVKETSDNEEVNGFCRNEMPANWIALYNGILRDRSCS